MGSKINNNIMNSRLFVRIKPNDESKHKNILEEIHSYLEANNSEQVYIISSPLGEKYSYSYEENVIVILIPKYKIIFLNLLEESNDFETYYEDFIEDLGSISDKYKYKEHIGRPRDWKGKNTIKVGISDFNSIEKLLQSAKIDDKVDQRRSDLLISLLIGSINDIEKIGSEVPNTLLEKVKKNIILFDTDQTKFIYEDFGNKKIVTIQGLSGTGKTELLLHKLKDLYVSDDNTKIFFTCHNKALANTLRERIPTFFNFMKVEKQIEWHKRLWVNRAWGSGGNINTGLYSYICNFYNIPFLGYSKNVDYQKIFSEALSHINNIEESNFECAFDYILVDERQDFPEVFFEFCEKITKKKVFIAGDILQDIYENLEGKNQNIDIMLNKCYRTDPRTLMFAHSVGLGLFEGDKKLNWFEDDDWKSFGYIVNRVDQNNKELHLSREPLRRFEDVNIDEFKSVEIKESIHVDKVIDIIEELKKEDNNISPNDIAIILLDDNNEIYEYIDILSSSLNSKFGWQINRGYENKKQIEDTLYISNPNNVKGLEFPYVICITQGIGNTYRQRNILYTMLTRSFIKTYLLLNNNGNISHFEKGLRIINDKKYIKTIEPNDEERQHIESNLIKFKKDQHSESYDDFLERIFNKLGIDDIGKRSKLKDMLVHSSIKKFDEEETIKFIDFNNRYLN